MFFFIEKRQNFGPYPAMGRTHPWTAFFASPTSGSWSPGAARVVEGDLLLHSPQVDWNAEREK
jgi:hypothetical protein